MMNIEIMESWTDYAGITGVGGIASNWLLSSSSSITLINSAVIVGDRAISLNGDNQTGFSFTGRQMFAVPVTKVTIAMGFALTQMPEPENRFPEMLWILDSGGSTQCYITVTSTGKLIIVGENGAVIGTSHTNLTLNQSYRICWTIDMIGANNANTTFSINGFVDPGLNLNNVDLQDQSSVHMAGIQLRGPIGSPAGPGGNWECHDLIVGTGECVDWGPVEVLEGLPNSDIVSDWDPSTGVNNFANVDESQMNAETDYNSTETLNAKDIFGFSDPAIPERIIAVGVVSWHRKEDSATRKFRHILRLAGVDYAGPDIFSAESYARRLDAWVENPATTDEWDPAELGAMDGFGYEYMGS